MSTAQYDAVTRQRGAAVLTKLNRLRRENKQLQQANEIVKPATIKTIHRRIPEAQAA